MSLTEKQKKSANSIGGNAIIVSFILWLIAIWSPAYSMQFGLTGALVFIFAIFMIGGSK